MVTETAKPKPPTSKPRKVRATVDPNETPAQRFKRLGTLRLRRAVKDIGLMGNMAGPGYEFTDEQAQTIIMLLGEAVQKVDAKFRNRTEKNGAAESISL